MSQASVKVDHPVLNRANPDSGKAGAMINLEGDHLSSVMSVTWECEGEETTVEQGAESNKLVRAAVPQGMPHGNGTVRVTSRGGTSRKIPFTFIR